MPVPSRVVLVDDHALFRDGIRHLLELEADFQVVGEAGCSQSALELVEREKPDLVVLDVEIPGLHVTDTVRRINELTPDTAVIILTMHDNYALVRELLSLGVDGYLTKSVTRAELVGAVRTVIAKGQVVLAVSKKTFAPRSATGPLSLRELEVLNLVAGALSNYQISKQLHITESTVKRHLHNIFGKLNAVSRIDAVNKAILASIITAPAPSADQEGRLTGS